MSPGPLFVVTSSVESSAEETWNRWYDEEHLDEVMASSPAIESATRYRRRYGDAGDQYLAAYSFADRDGLESFVRDERLERMAADFERRWGAVSAIRWGAYLPIAHRG